MAQHAILRFEKHKGNPIRPLEAHHERQKDQYTSNPDSDPSRSKYNFLIDRVGRENIVSAVVHMDKKTSRLYLTFVLLMTG